MQTARNPGKLQQRFLPKKLRSNHEFFLQMLTVNKYGRVHCGISYIFRIPLKPLVAIQCST